MWKYKIFLTTIVLIFAVSRIDAGCFSKSVCDLRIDSNCYVHIDEAVDWNEAESCCVAWGGHLASIHSSGENYFLDSIRNKEKNTWIGLNDKANERTFVWTDGTSYDYKLWSHGEPNNAGGKEDCAHLWSKKFSRKFGWNDLPCGSTSYSSINTSYICQKKMCPCLKKSKCDIVMNDQCYIFADYKATWHEAERCCVEWGGHLASIHSDLENCVVNSIRDKEDWTWIGLNNATNGLYRWTDGTAYDYQNFAPGQPDNKNTERCINLFDQKRGELKWNDYVCNKETYGTIETSYVCKKAYNTTSSISPTQRIITSRMLENDD